jgi:hypothetical protein
MQQAVAVVVAVPAHIGEALVGHRCAVGIIQLLVELVAPVVEHYRATIELAITKQMQKPA